MGLIIMLNKDVIEMEKIKQNIFIADDHRFIIDGYKNGIVRYKPDEFEYIFTQANDCQTSYHAIINAVDTPFDFAFLDMSMPPYEDQNIHSGQDLAQLILKSMPKCKIILLTMWTEFLRVKTVMEAINPHGMVIKNDLTFKEFIFGFDKVMRGEQYLSESVIKMLEQSELDAIEIDQFDKDIIFHLAKGTKTADLSKYMSITIQAIERRKDNLKDMLKVPNATDAELVVAARKIGIIL